MGKISYVGTAFVLCVVGLPGALTAQSEDDDGTRAPGTWGVRFALPDGGGGSFGAVRFLSARTSLGLDLSGSYRSDALDVSSERDPAGRQREDTNWQLGLSSELRRYFVDDRSVNPFVAVAAGVQYDAATRGEDRRADAWTLSARTGVGAEWLPTDAVGISGSTGIRVRQRSEGREQDDPQAESSTTVWIVDTFRSALLLSLYF